MAIWLRRFSWLALAGFPLAVLGTRLGLYHFRIGFKLVEWTIILAVMVFLVGTIVWLWKRKSEPLQAGIARNAAMLCLIPVVGLAVPLSATRSVPPIHNISTDTLDPPAFVAVQALRGEGTNPLSYQAEEYASLQLEAYPGVKTLMSDLSLADAHTRALSLVDEMGWELVDSDPQGGRIEATVTTTLWGFKDDVVIRLRGLPGGEIAVDLRSVSRVGQSDLGANAKRIESFLQAFGS